MSTRKTDSAEITSGILLIFIALFFGCQTTGLDIGTALEMGPGYFPLILSGLLFLIGAIILIQGLRHTGEPIGEIAWRGILLIIPAPIFFGLTVRGLGFVPALFLTSLIAAQASVRMKWRLALLLSGLVTLFSTLIFSYALDLPFQRFGPWLPL